jgi:flagellar basal body-associated protein FliL
MEIIIKRILMMAILGTMIIGLSACQNTQMASKEAASATGSSEQAQDDSIAAAQAAADNANTRANEAFQAAQTARRVAERGVEMANQNQAALRALNDKIDRMFETISRK